MSKKPLLVTIPHSGENVPEFCQWLKELPEEILMCDVDRYVDQLYAAIVQELQLKNIKTEWHRYAGDLNRFPSDVDSTSVVGNINKAGEHSRGFHWVITTLNHQLMKAPMSEEDHQKLIEIIYNPFHAKIKDAYFEIKEQGFKDIFHLDLHSMPSVGTNQHRDPGEVRADIVVSDNKGKSSKKEFVDLVITSYVRAGFKVAYNWPYFGGRVTEQYGDPARGHHAVQVELNRSLYMNEKTKKISPGLFEKTKQKLENAINSIYYAL